MIYMSLLKSCKSINAHGTKLLTSLTVNIIIIVSIPNTRIDQILTANDNTHVHTGNFSSDKISVLFSCSFLSLLCFFYVNFWKETSNYKEYRGYSSTCFQASKAEHRPGRRGIKQSFHDRIQMIDGWLLTLSLQPFQCTPIKQSKQSKTGTIIK